MLAGGALCLLALLLVMAAPVQAEWQNFLSSTDGLPDNQVLSLMEDRGGSMWFGSASGATRYDGQRWATLRDSLSGLPTVRAMVTDAGVGFNISDIDEARLGFKDSVVARLKEVGGNARLFSSPGSGTTVVLEVPK